MDIRALFTEYCGPSVLFISSSRENVRTIKIEYSIPAIDPEERRFVIGYLRNGLESVLRRQVLRAADHARMDAYRRTGHRDADLKRLLSGRTI